MKLPHTVEDVMTKKVATIHPKAALAEVARTIRRRNIGSLIVGDRGKILGIVTSRDLIRFVESGANTGESQVAKHMTRKVFTCSAQTKISEALHLMAKHKIHHLPVVDKARRLVGIVSKRDLIAATELISLYMI